jgi:ATP-binding cassette subfamily B protein
MPMARRSCITLALKWSSGKTYALVGPTGGGKTTTASLIARLYDPTKGDGIVERKEISKIMTPKSVHKK